MMTRSLLNPMKISLNVSLIWLMDHFSESISAVSSVLFLLDLNLHFGRNFVAGETNFRTNGIIGLSVRGLLSSGLVLLVKFMVRLESFSSLTRMENLTAVQSYVTAGF